MNDTLKKVLRQTDSAEAGKTLQDWIRLQARSALLTLVEEEVQLLCGPKHNPDKDSDFRRAGSSMSGVFIDGKKEQARKPRVRRRSKDEEVSLKTWKTAQDPKEWEEAMKRAVLCGVSCRNVRQMRESDLRGESKSNISRLWQRKAAVLVQEMQQSDLSEIDLLALMIDGVVLCRGLVATVAIGVDTQGYKQVLGFRVGSSENTEVCRDLLSNLRRRGLQKPKERKLFAVLDGSDPLKSALLEFFPKTVIQRCLVHKERNIRGYLSKRHWGELAELFRRLRICQGKTEAALAKRALIQFLEDKNAQALASLEECGDELVALFDLEVPNTLHVTFLSTNAIENAFRNLRRHIGRVARWRKETSQADQWLASGLMLAQKTFRRVRGYGDLPELIMALERENNEVEPAA